jgi:hypothetical protein
MTVRKFEYKTVNQIIDLENAGEEGWELVAVLPESNAGSAVFYLKREFKGYER